MRIVEVERERLRAVEVDRERLPGVVDLERDSSIGLGREIREGVMVVLERGVVPFELGVFRPSPEEDE